MTPDQQREVYATLKSARDYLSNLDMIRDEDHHDVLSRQIVDALAVTLPGGAPMRWCDDCQRYHDPGQHVAIPVPNLRSDNDDDEPAIVVDQEYQPNHPGWQLYQEKLHREGQE